MTLAELNIHLDMLTQLQEAREALRSIEGKILGAQNLDGMPHASGDSRKTESLSILLEARLDECARLERIVKKSEKDVNAFIETIEDMRTKIIFSLRYLAGMKWAEVAEYMGGGNTPESVKTICYRYLHEDNTV